MTKSSHRKQNDMIQHEKSIFNNKNTLMINENVIYIYKITWNMNVNCYLIDRGNISMAEHHIQD